MNRDLKRSFQKKAYDKKSTPFQVDAQKVITHNKIKQAMDEGIVFGFYCAVNMIGNICDEVAGIGEKRKDELIRIYQRKMLELKEKLKRGEI